MYKTVNCEKLGEKYYTYTHSTGLEIVVFPKTGYQKKYASFSTNYGSAINKFIAPNETEITTIPDGVAHFLEHKLFQQKDGDITTKFSAIGAFTNAYTSFMNTVYLFSCNENFYESFELLVNFVQNPYITEESVEKEKGIIAQEINMYEDSPDWRVFFNFLEALYVEHPVKIDIAGSVESIDKINREILMKAYDSFYSPSNMSIVVVGDVDIQKVIELVDKNLTFSSKGKTKKIEINEVENINKNYIEQSLHVSIPTFQMGFKDNYPIRIGIESLEYETSVRLILSMILGSSSELYDDLYSKGLINSSFNFDFIMENNFAFSSIGGESNNPKLVRDIILEKINHYKVEGLNEDDFIRIKKSSYGRFIKQFNSIEKIAHNINSIYFRDVNIFDLLTVYDKITFDKIKTVFNNHFVDDKFALSVVNPI